MNSHWGYYSLKLTFSISYCNKSQKTSAWFDLYLPQKHDICKWIYFMFISRLYSRTRCEQWKLLSRGGLWAHDSFSLNGHNCRKISTAEHFQYFLFSVSLSFSHHWCESPCGKPVLKVVMCIWQSMTELTRAVWWAADLKESCLIDKREWSMVWGAAWDSDCCSWPMSMATARGSKAFIRTWIIVATAYKVKWGLGYIPKMQAMSQKTVWIEI